MATTKFSLGVGSRAAPTPRQGPAPQDYTTRYTDYNPFADRPRPQPQQGTKREFEPAYEDFMDPDLFDEPEPEINPEVKRQRFDNDNNRRGVDPTLSQFYR